MRRQLSQLTWIASVAIVLVPVCLWIRSWFTADIVCRTLPGRWFIQVSCIPDFPGSFVFEAYGNWPGNHLSRWTTGPARFDGMREGKGDFSLLEVERKPTWMLPPTGRWSRGGFALEVGGIAVDLDAAGQPVTDESPREWGFGPDSGPGPVTPPLPHIGVEIPPRDLPVVGLVPLGLCVTAAGARRLRARRRTRRGQCARCGSDLRHSPERCPECGAASGT